MPALDFVLALGFAFSKAGGVIEAALLAVFHSARDFVDVSSGAVYSQLLRGFLNARFKTASVARSTAQIGASSSLRSVGRRSMFELGDKLSGE
jgi:hypothetical protein